MGRGRIDRTDWTLGMEAGRERDVQMLQCSDVLDSGEGELGVFAIGSE